MDVLPFAFLVVGFRIRAHALLLSTDTFINQNRPIKRAES